MKAAATVKPDVNSGNTAQGLYVMAADGTAFGFNNNRSADRLLSLLKRGEEQFKSHKAEKPVFEASDVSYARKPDVDTSVIRVHARIRPLPPGCNPSNENVAQDHLWITKSEVDGLLTGNQFSTNVIYRLARFHLVDNVRGEPDHWKTGEIKTAILDTKRKMEVNGYVVYDVRGRFEMSTPNNARGLSCFLEGQLTIHKDSATIYEMKVYGEGKAWGASTYTPNPPPGEFPIVFALINSSDSIAKIVGPQAIFFGREYFEPKR